MYTALYARVSTKSQAEKGTSLDGQLELCFKRAKDLKINKDMIKVYREEGFTAEDIDRPQMNQLRQDIKNKLITRIIITHPDRLSRELVDKLIVCNEFEKYEVELVFVDTEYKNTPEGELFFNMQSSIAQYELAMIKKRTSRGVIHSVKERKRVMPMRVPPYGYDYIDKNLSINKDEAEYVKKIYDWYVYEGLTMRQIGEKLYEFGAIPKRKESSNWSAASIQRVLQNEIYIGKYYYNRRKTQKIKGQKTASGNAKREYSYRDKEDWLLVEVPRIIDDSLFKLAQEKREHNGRHSGNLKHEYLLRGKIKCSCCGLRYSAYSTSTKQTNKKDGVTNKWTFKRYRCNGTVLRSYGDNVKKCQVPLLNVTDFDDHIWNTYIMEIVTNPNLIQEYGMNQGNEKELLIKKTFFTKQLTEKEKERERVKTMFKHGVIEEDEMIRDFTKINDEIAKIKTSLEDIASTLNDEKEQIDKVELLNNTIEQVRKIMGKGELSFDDKRNVVDLLIDEITVNYDEEGTMNVDISTILNTDLLNDLSKQHQGDKYTNHRVNFNGEITMNTERELGKKTSYDIIEKNFSMY
jgi:site-specific DNA recombinase